jgi:hypothetical protein
MKMPSIYDARSERLSRMSEAASSSSVQGGVIEDSAANDSVISPQSPPPLSTADRSVFWPEIRNPDPTPPEQMEGGVPEAPLDGENLAYPAVGTGAIALPENEPIEPLPDPAPDPLPDPVPLARPPIAPPAAGTAFFAVETVSCRPMGEALVLLLDGISYPEALTAAAAPGEASMRVEDRRALYFDPDRKGENPDKLRCVPIKRYCHEATSFDDWGGAPYRPGDVATFNVGAYSEDRKAESLHALAEAAAASCPAE